MRMTITYIDEFVQAYEECLLWSSVDETYEEQTTFQDGGYGVEDIHPDTAAGHVLECVDFIRHNLEDLDGIDAGQAGHDFWLTRNHHGAGFWDRGLGEVGDRLTKAAHVYGGVDPYLGDDGKIHE
jgi:hypothetical protein